jgi:hypothetical protein
MQQQIKFRFCKTILTNEENGTIVALFANKTLVIRSIYEFCIIKDTPEGIGAVCCFPFTAI